jgi:transposase InsO family protein
MISINKFLLKRFGVPLKRFQYWTRSVRLCSSTIEGLCRIRHPHQLTPREIITIRRWLRKEKYSHWSRVSIYHQMSQSEGAFCSKTTFYAYALWLGFKNRRFKSHRKKGPGIRASRPGEALNNVLKNQYIRGRKFKSLSELQDFLDEFLRDYNHRPHGSLDGSRPANVLAGEIPDRFRYREEIITARQKRIQENLAFDCNTCSADIIADG